VDPRDGHDDLEKRKLWPYGYSNSDPSVVQPVDLRYTDYATTVTMKRRVRVKCIFQSGADRIFKAQLLLQGFVYIIIITTSNLGANLYMVPRPLSFPNYGQGK
jgi:hypothetical protein